MAVLLKPTTVEPSAEIPRASEWVAPVRKPRGVNEAAEARVDERKRHATARSRIEMLVWRFIDLPCEKAHWSIQNNL